MKVLYHIPSLNSIYAQRTIYHGFNNAFIDLGHEFLPFTADNNLSDMIETYRPDLFITASHSYYRKYIDFDLLAQYRREGLFVLVKIDFWDSPISALRINEARSMKDDTKLLNLISSGKMGDAFFHVLEQDDPRMDGFKQTTGHKYHTIPLAADKTLLKPIYDERFKADISYVGTALPEKRKFFKDNLYPLGHKYNLRLYGQDWTYLDRTLGWVQRAGQYFNVKILSRIRKPKLTFEEEAKIYGSSAVSVNVHEEYQRNYGGDCNERTFKIPLCGGFEVVDNVACIKKYFVSNKELIIAKNSEEWVAMVQYYLNHPKERELIIEAGKKRVLNNHTYQNRVDQMIKIKNGDDS